MYKAIGFDLGGVIIEGAPQLIYQAIARRFGVSQADLRKIMDKYLPSYDRGEINPEQFWRGVTTDLGVEFDLALDEKLWSERYISWSPIRQDVLNLVDRLKANSYKVGLLSNIDSEHGKLNVDRGIFEHFEQVLLSYQIHARKPEAEAFMALARALSVEPQEMIFVDDLIVNIEGAQKLGIKGIQYRDYDSLVAELAQLGVQTG